MNKNILITGGCGYIGSHIALLFKEQGFNVIVVDNLSTGHAKNRLKGVTYEIGDIGNIDFLNQVLRHYSIETVMHLAAKTSVEESLQQPEFYYEENLFKSIVLMKACGQYQIKHFIFSSTAAVYGQITSQTIKENHRINPNNPYGKSKYIAELALSHLAREYAMQFTVLRYFNVAGHHHSLTIGNHQLSSTALISVISRNIAARHFSIILNGNDFATHDGTCVRDYIHVMDIANVHLFFVNRYYQSSNKNENLTVNVGYGKGLSILDVIKLVNDMQASKLLSYSIGKRRKGDIAYSVADNTQIKSLGWKSLFEDPYKEIITSEIAWYKKILSV